MCAKRALPNFRIWYNCCDLPFRSDRLSLLAKLRDLTILTTGAQSCTPPEIQKWVVWIPSSHRCTLWPSKLLLVTAAWPYVRLHFNKTRKPLNKLPENFLAGWAGASAACTKWPSYRQRWKDKVWHKERANERAGCNSDPYGLFLSSSNKKCNSCDEYSPTVVFLPSNNNFNWTLQHVEYLCFLGHKSSMWSKDLKNGLLKDSNASISPRTRLINLLCKMITFYREESLLDIH